MQNPADKNSAKQNYLQAVSCKSGILYAVSVAALLLFLPLLGIISIGRPLGAYLEFPPLTAYVEHAGFSWTVFCLLALFIISAITPFLIKIFNSSVNRADLQGAFLMRSFPLWGWVAVISCLIFWVLAWNRVEWFSFFQPYTFSPLWISFIVAVNAATFARSGRCMLKNNTLYFILLFPLSSVFWWFFEYLNRFVQNWHYIGAEIFSPFEYATFATLCFSTVLPAVLSVCEFFETFLAISSPLDNFVRVKFLNTKSVAGIILVLACAGLAVIGRYPDYFFPILWLSPLLIITSLQTLKGQDNIFSGITEGRWRKLFLLAISALVCGLFWEMWNFYSLPKWAYSVPFVNRFHLFEMPILGYAGYLPFGIACAVIGGLLKDFILRKNRNLFFYTKQMLLIFILFFAPLLLVSCKTVVKGRVTDAEGKPIADARLLIMDVDSDTKPFHQSETRSDVNGSFMLNALPGNSNLSVYADGHASMYFTRKVYTGVNRNWNFVLPKAARVSGKILDSKGNPLSNRSLLLLPIGDRPSSVTGASFHAMNYRQGNLSTDKDGILDILNVSPGKYSIVVYGSSPANNLQMWQKPVKGRLLEVEAGERVEGFEIRVNPPEDYAISGHVRDAGGKPVRQAFVDTYIPHRSHWWSITDNEGAFFIKGLDGMGQSFFTLNLNGVVEGKSFEFVIPNVPLNSRNLEVVVPEKGNIYGTVHNVKTGELVTTYQVTIPVVHFLDSGAIWEKPKVQVQFNSDASFSISGIFAGQASVEVYADGLGTQRFLAQVEAGKSKMLTCEMLGPAVFSGQTTKDSKGRGANIRINGKWVRSGDDGNFRFDKYPNGEYTIGTWDGGWNYRSFEIQLKSGETTRLDMEMGGSCEIRGSLIFPEEEGPCMVRLAAKPAPGKCFDGGQPNPEEFVVSCNVVQHSGDEYRFSDIPPGNWYLIVGTKRFLSNGYSLAMSKLIELKEGERMLLNLDLTKAEENKAER